PLSLERVALHRVAVEGIVGPEGLGEVLAAEEVEHRLHAGAEQDAALDEVALQLRAVVGGAAEDVAAPEQGFVGGIGDVRAPGLLERGVVERREVAHPGEQVVAEVHAADDELGGFGHQLAEALGVRHAPGLGGIEAVDLGLVGGRQRGQPTLLPLLRRHSNRLTTASRPDQLSAQVACARTTGLARKATETPARAIIFRSLAPSPMATLSSFPAFNSPSTCEKRAALAS